MEDRNDDDANYFSSVLLWSICCNISHLDGREHLVEIQFCYWFSEFALVHHTVEQLPSLHPTPRNNTISILSCWALTGAELTAPR